MIYNNIITKHIALIILRNRILVIIVIGFEKFLMTSEKILLRIKSRKISLVQNSIQFTKNKILFNTSH